uniref:Cytochrome c oxidase subunit 3 n=1 Tax=Scolia bicincta TaxID=427966 RepID=A0A1L2D334_9HYME|nr:cytochrome c oxidase subunit 3 [Scolia bicincta]
MNKEKLYYPYYLTSYSPWPFFISIALMNLMLSSLMWINLNNINLFIFNLLLLLLVMFQWWRDLIREFTFLGMMSNLLYFNLRFSMILFILSEVFFFFSFFWAYFHYALSPDIMIGNMWPPLGIDCFNPNDIPLMNSIILIFSGFTITWSHFSLLNNNMKLSMISLNMTIILGIYFTIMQIYEYQEAKFTICDSSYGSIFFMMTGFHGLHVIVGTIFLIVQKFRMQNKHFMFTRHLGFESSSWYWHFVDVVWLFLYINVYWW